MLTSAAARRVPERDRSGLPGLDPTRRPLPVLRSNGLLQELLVPGPARSQPFGPSANHRLSVRLRKHMPAMVPGRRKQSSGRDASLLAPACLAQSALLAGQSQTLRECKDVLGTCPSAPSCTLGEPGSFGWPRKPLDALWCQATGFRICSPPHETGVGQASCSRLGIGPCPSPSGGHARPLMPQADVVR